MCTAEKSFAIRGVQDCPKRGYKRTGFFEVDTGEAQEWTIRLTDPDEKELNKMRRKRRVKIVATLGPASSSPEVLERLFLAGVDVFRINMSHSTHEVARTLARTVRDVGAKHRHPIGILADLQGPKFRARRVPRRERCRQERRDLPLRPDASRRARRSASFFRTRRSSKPSSRGTCCCSTTARSACASSSGSLEHRGRSHHRRQARQPQGREPARYRCCHQPAHGKGPRGPRLGT